MQRTPIHRRGIVPALVALGASVFHPRAALAQSAPAARVCTPSGTVTIDPDGGRVIGMWRDPSNGSIHAAIAAPREIRVWQLSLNFASNHEFTAILPGRATTPMRAWRGANGDVLVSWRTGTGDRLQLSGARSLHLGRLALGNVADIPIARPPRTSHERMFGPLDDPSASRLAGIMAFVRAPGGGESQTVVLVDTTQANPQLDASGSPSALPGAVNLDDTGSHVAGGSLLIAGENGIGATILRDGHDAEPLGPHGPFSMGRFSVERLSRSHGSGFPRIVMFASGTGLALWTPVPASGGDPLALSVQPIDARGHATSEPVVHALDLSTRSGIAPPALRDVAIVGDEVWVTVQTGIDVASTPPRATLVRLDAHGAQIAPPVNVSLEAPFIAPVGSDAAFLWSEQGSTAVIVRCVAPSSTSRARSP